MKEWFQKMISGKSELNSPTPISDPHPAERYPVGPRGREEYVGKQSERKFRTKISSPYLGNRVDEYTLQFIKAASETPANKRKRSLWLNKGQREINRQKAALPRKKLFD